MNIFQRIRARATGVLGHDCSGKPLRKGDRVEPALPPERVRDGCQCVMEVVGIEPDQKRFPGRIELKVPGGPYVCGRPEHLRKITDGDQAAWESITESTGWKPRAMTSEEEQEVSA